MTEYRVIWQIDIEAESAREAAEKAQEIQRDPESQATCFLVLEPVTDGVYAVDLEPEARHESQH